MGISSIKLVKIKKIFQGKLITDHQIQIPYALARSEVVIQEET